MMQISHMGAQSPNQNQAPPWIADEWSSGLLSCCGEDGNCCFCCLASVMPGVAQAILLTDLGTFESCTCPGLCYSALDIFTGKSVMPLILLSLRINMVKKLRRKESECESFCKVICCYTCSIAQMQRDAHSRKYVFQTPEDICQVALAAAGDITGYARQYTPMTYAPIITNSQI